jgi:hypothetical protein
MNINEAMAALARQVSLAIAAEITRQPAVSGRTAPPRRVCRAIPARAMMRQGRAGPRGRPTP